jgi:PAS domain S-box-containing protein
VNKTALELFKARSKEELRRGLDKTFREKSYGAFSEELVSLADGKTMFETETLTQTLTGDKKNIALRWTVAPGCEQTYSKVLVSITDITERKQAEEALQRSYSELSSLFDGLPLGIAYLTPDLRFVRTNKTHETLTGHKQEQLLGKFCYDVVGEYAQDPTRRGREKICSFCRTIEALEEGTIKEIERPLVDRTLNVISSPAKDEKGEIIGVMELIEDITERKQAEEKLRKSEEKFRSLVEHAHDAICIIQEDHFKFANQEFSDLLNYNWEELKQLDFKEVIAPEYRDMVADRYYRRQKGEEVPEKYELVLLTKDGERKSVELSVSLVDYLGEVASRWEP